MNGARAALSPRLLPAALAALFCLAACSGDDRGGQSVSVAAWATAEIGDVMRVVETSGVVRARDKAQVRVGSRIGGQIARMYVRTGQIVRKGQLLALIDDRELCDQRRAAQARLENALAEAQRIEAALPARMEEQRAKLAADRESREYSRRDATRRRTLQARGYLAKDGLDQAARDAAAGEHTVTASEAALARTAKDQSRELEKARRAVDEARAQVDLADARIAMTRIESPMDAIVGQVSTQAGEQVVAQVETVTILTLIDPRYLDLWIYVNEADAAGVRPGLAVRFFQPSRRDQVMAAVVSRVSPASELVDGVRYYPALAELPPDAARQVRPEMNVQCYVLTDERKGVLTLPNEAVMRRGAGYVVYADDGRGRGAPAAVRLGVRDGQRTEVLEGLAPGARVAVRLGDQDDRTRK